MAARVSKDNFEAEVLQASIPVLVEFYSDSCIPCKQMEESCDRTVCSCHSKACSDELS